MAPKFVDTGYGITLVKKGSTMSIVPRQRRPSGEGGVIVRPDGMYEALLSYTQADGAKKSLRKVVNNVADAEQYRQQFQHNYVQMVREGKIQLPGRYWTISEASQLTGIPTMTIHNWTRRDGIATLRSSGRVFLTKEGIEALLKKQTAQTLPQIVTPTETKPIETPRITSTPRITPHLPLRSIAVIGLSGLIGGLIARVIR